MIIDERKNYFSGVSFLFIFGLFNFYKVSRFCEPLTFESKIIKEFLYSSYESRNQNHALKKTESEKRWNEKINYNKKKIYFRLFYFYFEYHKVKILGHI